MYFADKDAFLIKYHDNTDNTQKVECTSMILTKSTLSKWENGSKQKQMFL